MPNSSKIHIKFVDAYVTFTHKILVKLENRYYPTNFAATQNHHLPLFSLSLFPVNPLSYTQKTHSHTHTKLKIVVHTTAPIFPFLYNSPCEAAT